MIFTSNYTTEYDEEREVYLIHNMDAPICPDCGELLSGYDHRRRKVVFSRGEVLVFSLRRLRCPRCHRYHIELPDFIIPGKHYHASIIADVIAGRIENCPAEDSTIRRWRKK